MAAGLKRLSFLANPSEGFDAVLKNHCELDFRLSEWEERSTGLLDATDAAGFTVVMDGQVGIGVAAALRVGISKIAVGLGLSILVDLSDDFSLSVLKNHLGWWALRVSDGEISAGWCVGRVPTVLATVQDGKAVEVEIWVKSYFWLSTLALDTSDDLGMGVSNNHLGWGLRTSGRVIIWADLCVSPTTGDAIVLDLVGISSGCVENLSVSSLFSPSSSDSIFDVPLFFFPLDSSSSESSSESPSSESSFSSSSFSASSSSLSPPSSCSPSLGSFFSCLPFFGSLFSSTIFDVCDC